jgi:hypothetical protein
MRKCFVIGRNTKANNQAETGKGVQMGTVSSAMMRNCGYGMNYSLYYFNTTKHEWGFIKTIFGPAQ